MNTPVSFELAKLLKEKGYPFEFITVGELKEVPLNIPTIAEVVMWLYEKHGIWIVVNPHKGKNNLGEFFMEFDPEVWSFTNECVFHNTELLYFNSPTEAYEAAIKYCLTNLIK